MSKQKMKKRKKLQDPSRRFNIRLMKQKNGAKLEEVIKTIKQEHFAEFTNRHDSLIQRVLSGRNDQKDWCLKHEPTEPILSMFLGMCCLRAPGHAMKVEDADPEP